MDNNKVLLMILDGWGKSNNPKVSAIDNAETPFIDSLYENYPNADLKTFGQEVGLPEGQMGNSEVGHLNLGAGRIVYQELSRINISIKNKELESNKILVQAYKYAEKNKKNIHLIGLVSKGGVHSHYNHLCELIKISEKFHANVFIHGFTDGRDVDPKSSINDSKSIDFVASLYSMLEDMIGGVVSFKIFWRRNLFRIKIVKLLRLLEGIIPWTEIVVGKE